MLSVRPAATGRARRACALSQQEHCERALSRQEATPWQGGQPSTQSYAEPGRSEDRGQWEAEQDLLTIAEETGLEVAKWYQKAGELIS